MYNGHGCPCGLIQMIEAVFFAMGLIIFVGFFSILFFREDEDPRRSHTDVHRGEDKKEFIGYGTKHYFFAASFKSSIQ